MKAAKRKWLIVYLWAQVIAVAAMIFFFSAQDGEDSMQVSGGVVDFLIRLLVPDFDGMAEGDRLAIYGQLQYLVRKAAHFTEFAMLGASLRLLFHALSLRQPILIAWAAGTLYACTDEMHQMFVDGRGAMWQDVCIDSAGVLTAVILISLRLRAKAGGRRRNYAGP